MLSSVGSLKHYQLSVCNEASGIEIAFEHHEAIVGTQEKEESLCIRSHTQFCPCLLVLGWL